MSANPLNWKASQMWTREIIIAVKNQPTLRLAELGRNKLFELISEVFYKWSLVQRIGSEERERALAGLIG